jgi:hypothetical protein
MAYDCKICLPWNLGPELCATQVEDQSFFYIDELVDPRIAREKDSTAIISIINGQATSKQMEQEFMGLMGASTWRWTARQLSEGRIVMRFPSAQMVKEWIGFRNYPMRNVDAQLKIAPWSNMGAKGMLQQAWFRVKDIPTDQRSIRTVAKVGGLVGKVLEIDEKSRLRPEFVRMRIVCRDMTKVPRKAEGTLG